MPLWLEGGLVLELESVCRAIVDEGVPCWQRQGPLGAVVCGGGGADGRLQMLVPVSMSMLVFTPPGPCLGLDIASGADVGGVGAVSDIGVVGAGG
eukprot:6799539-Alexandrium_andersonii.AAC.1